jgi:hypothetical protein
MLNMNFIGAGGAGHRLPEDLVPSFQEESVNVRVIQTLRERSGGQNPLGMHDRSLLITESEFNNFVSEYLDENDSSRYVLRFRMEHGGVNRPFTFINLSQTRDDFTLRISYIPLRGFPVKVKKLFYFKNDVYEEQVYEPCEDYDFFKKKYERNKTPAGRAVSIFDRFSACTFGVCLDNSEEEYLIEWRWDMIKRTDFIIVRYKLPCRITVRRVFNGRDGYHRIQDIQLTVILNQRGFTRFIDYYKKNNYILPEDEGRFKYINFCRTESRIPLNDDYWSKLVDDDVIFVFYSDHSR